VYFYELLALMSVNLVEVGVVAAVAPRLDVKIGLIGALFIRTLEGPQAFQIS
jgi:hypothetical protein